MCMFCTACPRCSRDRIRSSLLERREWEFVCVLNVFIPLRATSLMSMLFLYRPICLVAGDRLNNFIGCNIKSPSSGQFVGRRFGGFSNSSPPPSGLSVIQLRGRPVNASVRLCFLLMQVRGLFSAWCLWFLNHTPFLCDTIIPWYAILRFSRSQFFSVRRYLSHRLSMIILCRKKQTFYLIPA